MLNVGNLKTKVVPFSSWLVKLISTFNKSHNLFTIDKPNPVPLIWV